MITSLLSCCLTKLSVCSSFNLLFKVNLFSILIIFVPLLWTPSDLIGQYFGVTRGPELNVSVISWEQGYQLTCAVLWRSDCIGLALPSHVSPSVLAVVLSKLLPLLSVWLFSPPPPVLVCVFNGTSCYFQPLILMAVGLDRQVLLVQGWLRSRCA